MPNYFAYIALFCWPLVALVIFRVLPLSKALIWSMLAGYLLLPSNMGVKIPMIPLIDKGLVATVSAAVFCLIFEARDTRVRAGQPAAPSWNSSGRALFIVLLLMLVTAPMLTVMANTQPVMVGLRFLPGLRLYDAFSMLSAAIVAILPFLLAWRYLNTREAHREFLAALVAAAVLYSVPALFEVRMSPQLHVWVYGFFPHDFLQHIRAGGYRPTVFLNHGLMIGILFCLAAIAALVLWREALREGKPAAKWLLAAIWIAIALYFSKSLGALAVMMLLGAFVVFAGQRLQVTAAAVIAIVVLTYPALRTAKMIPVDQIQEFSASISEDRAQSLRFRLDNEDGLLARANQKPIWGWGGWGRNHLYSDDTGAMTSVTDGMWIILLGVYGWFGYFAYFGLLALPIIVYARRRREFGPSLITPGLMIVHSAILIDLLPNAGLVPYVWMIAGALTGFVLRQPSVETPAARISPPRPAPGQSALAPIWRSHGFDPTLPVRGQWAVGPRRLAR